MTEERPPAVGLRIRQAVRALMVTPDAHILLVRFEFPTRTVWALPGGGLEPGETHLQALSRELIEEVGMRDPVVGAHVWDREHIVPFENGLWDGQHDRFYTVQATECFAPTPAFSWDQLHAERLHELRWWHLDDIESATRDDVWFAPRSLGRHLRTLITTGPPPTPFDTGV